MPVKTVSDVMTRDVVRVEMDTPYKEIVDLVVGRGISAVPVVDGAGVLLGVVSETDLMCRQEHQGDEEPPSGLAGRHVRQQWCKVVALNARDLMTRPVVTITSDVPVAQAARKLAGSGLRRLFVVDDGRLVGVLARRDVLRGFLRDDADICGEIEHELYGHTLRADPRQVRVTVEDGVVWLTGRMDYQGDVVIAERLSRHVAGVVAVRNRMDFFWDGEGPHVDTAARAADVTRV